MQFLANPMVNMSLVVGGSGVLFSPPLEETKEIMINCLKEIVENTQEFPRIEKEIFPDYKDEDLFLLEVTWEEDYVQTLGRAESSGYVQTERGHLLLRGKIREYSLLRKNCGTARFLCPREK